MRSTKIKFGVVCVTASVLALSVGWAGGAGAADSRRLRHRVRHEVRLRQGHGQEGDRQADQARRDRHADPGRRLHDDRQVRQRVLPVRERQRRHQRPPDLVQALQRAAQPDAAGLARQEAHRERQGRRHRRQHELHRVRHQLEVLQVQGLHHHRRRRAGGVLRHADVRRDRTWARATATSVPRRRSCGAARSRSSIASPDTISAYADGGVVKVAEAAGIPSKVFPIKLPITDANSTVLQLVQAAGDGGGVIIDFTPDSAPALLQAAIAQGLVDKVLWGSSTPIANEFMAKQFPQFDGKIHINQEFSNITDKHARPRALPGDHEEVRAEDRARRRSARWASWSASSRPRRSWMPCQGRGDREVVQRGRAQPQERQDRHALQAVVRREEPRVPHPEQLGHHGRPTRAARSCRKTSASQSRRSTRSSRRRVPGRSSSSSTRASSGGRMTIRVPVSADG